MANVIKNVKHTVANTVGAAAETVEVSSQILADSTGLVTSTVRSTPSVLKALLQSPFAAAKGYLQESEGLSEDEAVQRAYHYLNAPVSETVTKSAEDAGKLLADLLKDDDDHSTNDTKRVESAGV